jgi:hypothetical protein
VVGYLPAVVFAGFVAGGGLPMLRHDWLCIRDRADFLSFTLASLAWSPDGIGTPRAYPTDYLLALVNAAIAFVAGSHISFTVFALGVGIVCVLGARALANLAAADAWTRFGLACFALFNPWVYNKVVSGHLAMICAYGATMGLIATCLCPKPRWTLAALFMCVVSVQIQFFLLALAFVACIAVVRRRPLPLVTGAIVALPSIVGVAANVHLVAGTPYALPWQSLQSIRPVEAAALTGYFPGYTRGFPPLAFDAVWAMSALALIGAATSRHRARTLGFAALAIGAWLWSTAFDGPLASVYAAAILHAPALEIFRELYDLVAYVAIAYIALAAAAGRKWPVLAKLAVLPGLVLVATWFVWPPARWWIDASELPRVSIDAPPHTRFALFPDEQPMTFGGRGSGLDPDAYARPGGVTPLDGSTAAYPAAVALRSFAQTKSTAELSALGVSRIIVRPWLKTDARTLAHQLALPTGLATTLGGGTIALQAAPELALVSRLAVVALPPRIGSNAIFFGDVAGLRGEGIPNAWARFVAPVTLQPSGREISAARGWVDARQGFIAQPELAQGLGGVVTTSAAPLAVRAPARALVWVRGSLFGNAKLALLRSDGGYRWIGIPATVRTLRCRGECLVAALGTPPPAVAPSAPKAAVAAVPFRAAVPWLVVTDLPARRAGSFLRYEVGYDSHWLALTAHGVLPHLRVESAFNGWLVPAQGRPERVVLVEFIAAIQALCECIGLLWSVTLAVRFLRESARARNGPASF